VADLAVHATPEMPEPAPGETYRDPVFHTCVTRITDRTGDAGRKPEYSRVEAWNADGTLLLLMGTEGTRLLYDATTMTLLGEVPATTEPRWDAADPATLYHLDGLRLLAHDVVTGTTSLVYDFSNLLPGEDLAAVWTRWEGRPASDTRTWGFMAEDPDWAAAAFVVYDAVDDEVVALRDLRDLPAAQRDPDHVTMSPSGRFFLAAFEACPEGTLGDDRSPCGLMVYDRDLTFGRGLLRIVGHGDVALDGSGREVFVYQDIDTDHLSLVDLESGRITALWPIDFSSSPIGLHVSGLAVERPGWVLVSTYAGADATWMDDSVFAVELRPAGRVVRLAHTHSRVDPDHDHDYWAEPHATVNRDFTSVVFTSNWGRAGTEQVDTYLVEVPQGWLDPGG
jgi:hypothetical protein